jgi:hypothetical protein
MKYIFQIMHMDKKKFPLQKKLDKERYMNKDIIDQKLKRN